MASLASSAVASSQTDHSVEYTPQQIRAYLHDSSKDLLSVLPEPHDLITSPKATNHYLWAILTWPNIISFHSAAGNKVFDSSKDFDILQTEQVMLHEPFKALFALDGTDDQAKHRRTVLVYMCMSLGLINGFVTSAIVTRQAFKEGLVAIRAKQDAGEYKEDGPPLKGAVRFRKKVLERQTASRSFGSVESKYGHLEGYLRLEGQFWGKE
ncbi:hypothetical protein E8E11_002614 [Didymella keratinophila]|nr:hypothetical protein E8E11_002614 [Didymella keratinophila]